MLRTSALVLLFCLILLTGCSQVEVSQDYDRAFPFIQFSTFNWLPQKISDDSAFENNTLLQQRFHAAIEKNLLNRGYRITPSPDLLLNYEYNVKSKIQSNSSSPSVSFGYGHYGRYGGVGFHTDTDIYQYDQGILYINMYEGNTQRLVWRGKGTYIVSTHATPDQVSAQVQQLVTEILNQFPPQ